jgi:cytochrome c biogenesis protein CcmG, thiol:disulfide interchange protein DsbE
MRRLYALVPLVGFVPLLMVFALGLGKDPSQTPSVLINRPLPPLALSSVWPNRADLVSSDFKGEPTLLNVFASWCAGCQVEHPQLMALKDQGVVIHGLDWKDKPSDGMNYLQTQGDPFSKTGSDPTGRTGIDLGVTGVPETFVIDHEGRVRYKHIGPISPEDWQRTLRPMLVRLRSER